MGRTLNKARPYRTSCLSRGKAVRGRRGELARDLRAGHRAELVERWFLEALLFEPATGGVRKGAGLPGGDEGDGAAAEARAGEPGEAIPELLDEDRRW